MIQFIPTGSFIMNATKNVVLVDVASDLYEAGITEDGDRYIAELFYVMVEFENGVRVRHNMIFKGCKVVEGGEESDGMVFFEDIRVDQMIKAEKLAARVREALAAGAALDPAHWTEAEPVYGSRAYEVRVSEMTKEERSL
jgi:hypothetical protein